MGCKKTLHDHQLYYFTSCPFCVKVRMAMWKMRIRIPLRNIHSNAEYKQQLEEGGGKVQVPCLRIEKEGEEIVWMYESDDIVRYLRQVKVS